MKNTLKLATLACALAFSSLSAASQAMTLQDSVEKAVLSNPEIGAQFQHFHSSVEGKNIARSALLPEVNSSARVGKEWEGGSNWSRNGYTLEMRQLLFDGMASVNEMRLMGLEKLSEYYNLLATVDSVALEATLAHIDVLRYRDMKMLAQENFDMHVDTRAQIEERMNAGVGRGVDLEQAYGREALAQSNLMVEQGNLDDVLQRYRRIVGVTAPEVLLAPPSVTADLPESAENVIAPLIQNPSIRAKQALVQAADKGRSIAKGRLSPTVEFKAATGRDKNPGPNNPNYKTSQASRVMLEASFNLYNGGADSSRIRQTAAQEYAAKEVRDHTCRNMRQELTIAWNAIERINSQIPYLEAHELATSKVRVAYKQQFQIGERSLLDVLDTENELFDARRALANAQYDLQQAEFTWLNYAHKLLSSLEISDPYLASAPEELSQLELTEEVIEQCITPSPVMPDYSDISIKYGEGLEPPVILNLSNSSSF